jgi:hypothetical protein
LKLYALKYKDKYIKKDKKTGCTMVTIEKASVFNEKKLDNFEILLHEIKKKNISELKLVELIVVENENFEGGNLLKEKIKEIIE